MGTLATKRRERGNITQIDIDPFLIMPTDKLLCHLISPTPTIRTCAATVLGNHKESKVVTALCRQIRIEKKLYCRMAISDSLINIGSLSIQPLLALLGKVGHNQEINIPKKGFNKTSYPLPRDIAARTLCRMGGSILPEAFEFIENNGQPFALEQAIDIIGHIVYTNKLDIDSEILIQLSGKYSEYPMIQFKITRCFSGFSDNIAKQFLYSMLKSSELGLQFEAARSLVLSDQNLPVKGFEINEDVRVFAQQLTIKFSGRKKPRR
ncbi:MAG: hypothetical protein GY795_39390 [Desulfobacterales bacterium]|nr:hypothetical protein [Desulfobacterales bacterium]